MPTPVPAGYHSVSPYLSVNGADRLIEFLTDAFAAKVTEQILRPDGSVSHAEVQIGNSVIMMTEATDHLPAMPAGLYLYVNDVDATYQRALGAGAEPMSEPTDQFHGDRMGGVVDPSGNRWWIATHIEDVDPDELQRRATAHA
jgi:PhnB protein